MKKSKIVGTIISSIVVVAGVFFVVYNAVIVYNSDLKYLSYRSVDATISTVQSTYIDGKNYYMATYSYVIDGMTYKVDTGFTSDEKKYIVGSTGTVRYDTKVPSNSYIDDGKFIWNYLYLGISCIMLIFGIRFFDKQLRAK